MSPGDVTVPLHPRRGPDEPITCSLLASEAAVLDLRWGTQPQVELDGKPLRAFWDAHALQLRLVGLSEQLGRRITHLRLRRVAGVLTVTPRRRGRSSASAPAIDELLAAGAFVDPDRHRDSLLAARIQAELGRARTGPAFQLPRHVAPEVAGRAAQWDLEGGRVRCLLGGLPAVEPLAMLIGAVRAMVRGVVRWVHVIGPPSEVEAWWRQLSPLRPSRLDDRCSVQPSTRPGLRLTGTPEQTLLLTMEPRATWGPHTRPDLRSLAGIWIVDLLPAVGRPRWWEWLDPDLFDEMDVATERFRPTGKAGTAVPEQASGAHPRLRRADGARARWAAQHRLARSTSGPWEDAPPARDLGSDGDRPPPASVGAWATLVARVAGPNVELVHRRPGVMQMTGTPSWPLPDGSAMLLHSDGGHDDEAVAAPGAGVDVRPQSPLGLRLLDEAARRAVAVEVAVPPDLHAIPSTRHADGLQLVRRTLRRPRTAEVTASFIRWGEEHPAPIDVTAGRIQAHGLPRVWLRPGETEHPGMPASSTVGRQIAAARRTAREKRDRTADLLALVIRGGEDFTIREVWRLQDGREVVVVASLGPDGTPTVKDATGNPIATLAVCDDLHATDDAWIRTCPACTRKRCPTCAGGTAFGRCPLCAQPACRECLSTAAPCHSCRHPTRDATLDTPHEVAWRIRGATLLVSAHGARLLGGGTTTLLADDEHVANPSYAAARSAVAAAGLPWDAPVVAAPSDRPRRARTRRWELERREVLAVEPGPSRPEAVAFDRPHLLPQGPPVAVRPASHLAARGLLRTLRERVPPPQGKELRVSVVTHGLALELGRGGFSLVHTEGSEVRRDPLDLIPLEQPEVDPKGFLLAHWSSHGVTVRCWSVNRSLVYEVDDRGSTQDFFVPADDQTSHGSELAWHRLMLSHGVTTPSVVVVPPEGLPTGDQLSHPEPAAELVARHITISSMPADPAEGWVAADDRALSALDRQPITTSSEVVGRRLADDLRRQLRSVVAADPQDFGVTTLATIHEIWRGAAERRVVRQAVGRTACLPEADDGSGPTSDFTVDDAGHLVPTANVVRCEACRRSTCPACEQGLQLTSCPTCEQRCCQQCASREAGRTTESCVDCRRKGCTACGRHLDQAPCRTCQRLVCCWCQSDGRCAPCRDLLTGGAPDPTVAQLLACPPTNLATARTGDGWVAWFRRASTSGVAVIAEQRVVRLVVGPDAELPLSSLVRSRALGRSVQLRVPERKRDAGAGWDTPLRSKDPTCLELATRQELVVELPGGGTIPLAPEETFDRRLAAALGKSVQPEVVVIEGDELLDAGASSISDHDESRPRRRRRRQAKQETVEQLSLLSTRVTVDLEPGGLVVRQGREGSERRQPWQVEGRWQDDGWWTDQVVEDPVVQVRRQSVGRASRLRVDFATGQRVDVTIDHDRRSELVAAACAELGPAGIEDIVDGVPIPDGDLPVMGARVLRTDVRPHLEVIDDVDGPARAVDDRLEAVLQSAGVTVTSDPGMQLPPGAAALLPPTTRPRGAAALLCLEVEQDIEAGSHAQRIRYTVVPGRDGPVYLVGGRSMAGLAVDREWHVIDPAQRRTCAYCGVVTCPRCAEPVGSCAVCQIVVCGTCASALGAALLCSACGDLVPAVAGTRATAPGAPRRGRLLLGDDPVHRVEALRRRGGHWVVWSLDRTSGWDEWRPVAPTELGRRHLDGR